MSIDIKRVLICDSIDSACIDLLKKHDMEVFCKLNLTVEELCKEVQDYDAAIVRSDTKFTREVLECGGGHLKVVAVGDSGLDNIDVAAATEKNIIVLNTTGGNSTSISEFTCILIGALERRIVPAVKSLVKGHWGRRLFKGQEFRGKTLAILGLGDIGVQVATRMKAYGMRIIGFDPLTTAEYAKSVGIEKMELNEIWPLADYITLHTSLDAETADLICAETLAKCKKRVKIINVSCVGIVNEKALLDAFQSGKCSGAAFDVYDEESLKSDVIKELIEHRKVLATPRLSALTDEAETRVAIEVAEKIIALTGKSTEYTSYAGVINREVLDYYQCK